MVFTAEYVKCPKCSNDFMLKEATLPQNRLVKPIMDDGEPGDNNGEFKPRPWDNPARAFPVALKRKKKAELK